MNGYHLLILMVVNGWRRPHHRRLMIMISQFGSCSASLTTIFAGCSGRPLIARHFGRAVSPGGSSENSGGVIRAVSKQTTRKRYCTRCCAGTLGEGALSQPQDVLIG